MSDRKERLFRYDVAILPSMEDAFLISGYIIGRESDEEAGRMATYWFEIKKISFQEMGGIYGEMFFRRIELEDLEEFPDLSNAEDIRSILKSSQPEVERVSGDVPAALAFFEKQMEGFKS